MRSLDPDLNFIHITDSETMKEAGEVHTVPPMRHKNAAFDPVLFVKSYIKAAWLTIRLERAYRFDAVIGFGPGVCIPVFMVSKLLGIKKRIFFEDWCRFTSKSLSGKACSPFSTKVFVQNESLKELYHNAEFAGRL
jgi:UDP-N-acetylglucosamine:LPS N-acetylglucosamine transferase